jgi:Plavaka transposase
MADFLFREVQMSGNKVDRHMELLAALYPDTEPPYVDAKDMYNQIDEISFGDSPWKSFEVEYSGHIEDNNPPAWKTATYEVWHRDPLRVMENQIGNPDFSKEMDYAAKQVFKDGKRQYTDLMSGNWAWDQAVCQVTNIIHMF